MKKIVCAVVALLLTLPAWAKLNAHEEARINAMLNALAQKKDLTSFVTVMRITARKPYRTCA